MASEPTQTKTLRRKYAAALYKRLRRIKGYIRTGVETNDALRLGQSALAKAPEDFRFHTDERKQQAFRQWLNQALREEFLEPVGRGQLRRGQHYTGTFVRSAYQKGIRFARRKLKALGVELPGGSGSVDGTFNLPIHKETLRSLYKRNFKALKDITEALDEAISETLTEGFAEGVNPREMADRLNDRVDKIGITRARTLARTETLNAHSSASLDEYQRGGVSSVKHGEWLATNDSRTCPVCRSIDGKEYPIDEFRTGTFEFEGQEYRLKPPAHPRGRCAVAPVVN